MHRSILVALSDTHAGHKLGLLNPKTVLYDETPQGVSVPYTPTMTACQEYLWKLYTDAIEDVQHFANGDEIRVIHNGDITQGNAFKHSLVSTRPSDQIIIAAHNMLPWMKIENMSTFQVMFGTEVHNNGEGSNEALVAEILSARFPNKKIDACYHGYFHVDGIRVDTSHHGPYHGSKEWLYGNIARFYLRDLMLQEITSGRKPPDLVLRSHYHKYVNELLRMMWKGNWTASRMIVTPCWCFHDDYIRKSSRSDHYVHNGLVAFEIIEGEITRVYDKWCRMVDIRTEKTL